MSRSPRFLPPNTTVEITARIWDGRPLLLPTPEFIQRTNTILARAVELYPVALHAYQFMPNHLHMDATGRDQEATSQFESYVLGKVATAVRQVTEWTGPVWPRRCSTIPILDNLAMERRFRYLLSNGVKEGLVASPFDWEGVSSARTLLTGVPVEAMRRVRTHRSFKLVPLGPIVLTPLPCWAHLSELERRDRVAVMASEIIEEARRKRQGKPVLGMAGVLAQDPFTPIELRRTPAPLCYATDTKAWADFLVARRAFMEQHRAGSAQFRETGSSERCPEQGFVPGRFIASRTPRVIDVDSIETAPSAQTRALVKFGTR